MRSQDLHQVADGIWVTASRQAQDDAIGPFNFDGPGVQDLAMHWVGDEPDWNKRTCHSGKVVRS
jgi:hypothetical protein